MPASVELVDTMLAVTPGEAVSTRVRLSNTGRIVDELTVEVIGDAAAWATVDPPRVPLFPGANGEATITFRPPRTPLPFAGLVPFGIRVRSQDDKSFSYVAEGRLQVGVVMDVAARLTPRSSVGSRTGQGARHRIEVDNNSNTTARVTLAAADADERLSFQIAQPVLTIPPGGRVVTTVNVKGRARMLTGAAAALPFQVVAAPDGAPPITLDGSMSQRSTLAGGINQIIAVAVVIGVGAVLASQILPRLGPAPTPAPSAASSLPPAATTAVASDAPSATAAPENATPASTDAPTATPTEAPTATPPPATESPAESTPPPPTATPEPSATPSPSSPPPVTMRIVNLGLVDPLGRVPEPTATPVGPAPTPRPSGPGQPFPSFPTVTLPIAGTSGGAIAAVGHFPQVPQILAPPVAQEAVPPPVQQFGIQVTGPVTAQITRVSDATSPTLCLAATDIEQRCDATGAPIEGLPKGPDLTAWFLSVIAAQGGTSVDVSLGYQPQAVTFGFQNLHLAGVSTTPGVHIVVQASAAGLIEVVTQTNVAADVTVAIRDLNTGVAPPPSTSPAGISGAPFLAAAEPGHFYDILLTSSSPDEVFVSGQISWP